MRAKVHGNSLNQRTVITRGGAQSRTGVVFGALRDPQTNDGPGIAPGPS
jgi:hypothetical protein